MKKILGIIALVMWLPISVYAQGLPLKDGVASTLATVSSCGTPNCINVITPTAPASAGYVKEADKDGQTGNFTHEYRQSIGVDNLQFQEIVDGTVVNTNNWNPASLTMTQAITNGFLVLNSAANANINLYSILTSNKVFPLYTQFANHFSWMLKTPNVPQANAVMEVGIGFVATTGAPTQSGALFRWNSDGTFIASVLWSGVQINSGTLANPSINVVHTFDIFINHKNVTFYVDDVLVATIVPGGNAVPMVPAHIPLVVRVYTLAGIPADAPQLFISLATAIQKDLQNNKLWPDTLAGIDRGSYVNPVTTFLQTANHANSTSPASATLSNTAAGYTTLGGRYQFAAPALLATDYALFGYQVPTGFTLHVSQVCISPVIVTGVAVVTTTLFDWSVGTQSSAVSLATADAVGPPMTWSPRRIPLGTQSLIALSALGTQAGEICRIFATPLVTNSGRFFHIILQVPSGAATASLVFRGDVFVNGYFE